MLAKRNAFTLLEVLLSLLLLFTMGLALMKLDGWIKSDIARYRDKALLLYQATPLLCTPIGSIQKRRISLYDTLSFIKLRDDEIFWLKKIEAEAIIGKMRKKSLFQTEDLDLTYRFYPLRIKQKDLSMGFVRIQP